MHQTQRIQVNAQEMGVLKSQLSDIQAKMLEVAGSAYVTQSLFVISKGRAVNAMNDLLAVLVTCGEQLETVVQQTTTFLAQAVDDFEQTDTRLATKISRET